MPLSVVAPIICEAPIEFEHRDGLVYVHNPAGFVSVLRTHTFYASFHNAAKCMQECHGAQSAEIIEFPRAEPVAKH